MLYKKVYKWLFAPASNYVGTNYNALQKHEYTLLHTYVCTERIFDSWPFIYNNIF